jgi:dipeptidyl aminopeptidase/acylaminoacyl peptidase
VAIFGGSYGGYAALIGATFTPTMFACIVDLFGWGDLVVALKNLPAYWGPRLAQWYERVGNPHTEPEFLWSRSPLSRIDDLCRPLLIAQGGNDVRVPQEASEQIVAELNKRNLDHVYLVFPDEGHEFVHLHNVVAFYSEAEQFLARHLGTTPNSGHSRPATPS